MRRLKLAQPCSVPWHEMSGNGLVRHCAHCDRQVHDLSGMTQAQAAALLLGSTGRGLCVRFQHDGAQLLFDPTKKQSTAMSARTTAGLAAAIAISVAACGTIATQADPDSPKEACSQASPCVVTVEETLGVMILESVQFARGDVALDVSDQTIIVQVAETLQKVPEISRVAIIGHASSDEPDAQALSERRAERVFEALVALEVDPQKLLIEGRGFSEPITGNATEDERARNRRIDFKILEMAGQ